jgi:ubiquinone biosynthesis protein Coq4
MKFKHTDRDICALALNTLFIHEYDLEKIVTNFPHIKPCEIALKFVNFAELYKNEHREYIARNIISRNELYQLIESNKTHYIDSEIQNNPEFIKKAVTCELYERGFFKI